MKPLFAREREVLRLLFDAALAAVDPARCLPPHVADLASAPPQRTIVVGAGKAAAAMAQVLEAHWRGPLAGLVVAPRGHAVPCSRIEVIEAAHPVPDGAAVRAGSRVLALVRGLQRDDLVLALFSGGGSALLAAPLGPVSLADKQRITAALLASGARIGEINCVRKHLSAIKGGRLAAAAWPARVVTIVLSDVPGDDAATIASGPTLPDETTCADALGVLGRHGIAVPDTVREGLASGAFESVKPAAFSAHPPEVRLIASGKTALAAAAKAARPLGIVSLDLGDRIEAEARELGRVIAGVALSCAEASAPLGPPCVLLSGGEATVTVQGSGRGGRNTEFLLSLALSLEDGRAPARIHALACDTDGIDGTGDNAGAIIVPDTLARARAAGLDARELLRDNDAYAFFAALNDLVVTGPTLTNVNDFRAVLIV